MTAPKPHDPRALRVTPEEVERQVTEILGESPSTLAEEAEQLARAHDVVHNALQ
ncbi:hypothetical protein QVA66_00020 [Staphylococcus chromogenes]|nr:hypothetical protein [Staphylococcus chromogenes]